MRHVDCMSLYDMSGMSHQLSRNQTYLTFFSQRQMNITDSGTKILFVVTGTFDHWKHAKISLKQYCHEGDLRESIEMGARAEHHHNMRSSKALFSSHASNTSTVKKSHLPTNIVANDHAKQFSATEISPIQVTFCKKKKKL